MAFRKTSHPADQRTLMGQGPSYEPANRRTGELANRRTGEPANRRTGKLADRQTGEL